MTPGAKLRALRNRKEPDDDQLEKSINSLEDRQLAFCREFIIDYNVTKSAARAEISRSYAQALLKKNSILDVIQMMQSRIDNGLATDPDMLLGQMSIWANSNMKDFFRKDGSFVGVENLTREQASCIKKIKLKPTEYGTEITFELYDASKANENLSRPHGLYDKQSDVSDILKDMSHDEIAALAKLAKGESDEQ